MRAATLFCVVLAVRGIGLRSRHFMGLSSTSISLNDTAAGFGPGSADAASTSFLTCIWCLTDRTIFSSSCSLLPTSAARSGPMDSTSLTGSNPSRSAFWLRWIARVSSSTLRITSPALFSFFGGSSMYSGPVGWYTSFSPPSCAPPLAFAGGRAFFFFSVGGCSISWEPFSCDSCDAAVPCCIACDAVSGCCAAGRAALLFGARGAGVDPACSLARSGGGRAPCVGPASRGGGFQAGVWAFSGGSWIFKTLRT
mmetsp:Transcript_61741/g.147653  ORF Transcript_61741/g.147653 Transcript_61741/m.147653 type:complete len:253 (-) Transcript_61741:27-785(-)